ncbi:MAG: hypothetical protein JWO78_689 [Micavibrio sp.]|nr:hypothetical protein [Micavibrio sp.]
MFNLVISGAPRDCFKFLKAAALSEERTDKFNLQFASEVLHAGNKVGVNEVDTKSIEAEVARKNRRQANAGSCGI